MHNNLYEVLPYKGSTGARNDIISGQIQMMFDSVPTMAQMVEAGRVVALGTTGKVRSPILPDVPTLVDLLNREINKIITRPEIKIGWEKLGAAPLAMTAQEFGAFVQSEIDRWAMVIKTNDIKPE